MKSQIVQRIFIEFIIDKAAWSYKKIPIIVLNIVFIQILYILFESYTLSSNNIWMLYLFSKIKIFDYEIKIHVLFFVIP